MELSALSLRLRALSVLRGLLSHPLVRAYGDTLIALDGTAADFATATAHYARPASPAAISRRQCSTPCTLTPTP